MLAENLHDDILHLQTRCLYQLFIIFSLLHLTLEAEPISSPVNYLHKCFHWRFIKNHIISTKPYCPTNRRCTH
ncbi:Serine/threonine-protein kinase CTR1 [Zea mays]|uniref:Serine/threonine-protein kinase CTR1 n=1 Tax=Zea mays TaxID=4577 RepID=A0A1D6H9N4_MAIZE|nr:Serine/threonine-protein kinase CTR1 [Zea mays]